jgi:hypothetical protein
MSHQLPTLDTLTQACADHGGTQVREPLGILLLSTDILRRHGTKLSNTQRREQLHAMHEAGQALALQLASTSRL